MKNYYNFLIPILTSGLIFWSVNGYSNTNSFIDENLGVEVCYNNPFTAEDIYINEINYRSPGEGNIDFVELYNSGTTAVDLSGWSLTDGITYTFPSGTSIGAGTYIVIAASPSDLQSEFGITGVLGPYSGGLSSDEEEVILRDNNFIIIDEVEYESWKEWPAVRYSNDGDNAISIQKLNPTLPSKDAGSWSSAFPTPLLVNSVFISNLNEIPIVNSVSKNPDKPTSTEVVRIKTDISNIADLTGSLTVNLEYQIVDPGNYISKSSSDYLNNWIAVPMLDDGTGPDSTANNGVFTAELPASMQQHRRLVRYRVNVSHSSGYTRTFPDPNHIESNYAYYVYDNYPLVNGYDINTLPELQEITIITDEATREEFIGDGANNTNQYTGKDLMGEGTIVYKGKVYDHISFRPKGSSSRKHRVKPNIKVDFNSERKITTESDCGKSYSQGKSKLTLGGTWSGNIAAHGLNESLVYTVNRLSGTIPRNNDYAQLRIVDSSSELGDLEDFWGIFLIQEEYDGDYLNEHDFAEGNFWKTNRATRYREISHQGDFPNSESIPTYAPYNLKNSRDTLDTNANLPIAYGMIAANYIYGLNGNNYIGKHSYNEYYDSETQKYLSWWSDMDNAFGSPYDDVVIFTRDQVQYETLLKNRLDIIDEPLIIGFNNKLRSVIDLLLTDEQIDFLVDMESKKIYDPNASYDWTTVDKSRWNQDYDLGTIDAHVDWYKQWFQTRRAFLLNDILVESEIPAQPSISLSGNTSLNNITLSASSFSDPQGANTFAAMEWRVGEWSDPANPIYASCEPIYEIQDKWKSGEITSFSDSFTLPYNAQLEAGRTYKIRVRYKDNTGRWSHWSDAVSLVATPAVDPSAPNVVINEIMYNDLNCGAQFIELKNIEDNAVNLSSFSFTDGIDYTFPEGTSLGANEVLAIAKDADEFLLKYGYSPLGEFDGSLDDKGERLELTGWYDVIVDSLTYDNNNPWDEAPGEQSYSLELLDPYSDNNNPLNWFRSDVNCGTPYTENTRVCISTADAIVINEINYNSNNDVFDPGDWIELYNPSTNAMDISGWTLYDNGNQFILPQGTAIPANGYLVLVESSALFSSAFPDVPTDKYLGNMSFSFSNKGERISLFDENKCLADYVIYDDASPWPLTPDGGGPTLSLLDPAMDNALASSWDASASMNSYFINGSPGVVNSCIVGQPCNDGDACTTGETFDNACNCTGGIFQDTDNDGICNVEDSCPNLNNDLIGQTCDDGDACTSGETYDANCGCTGGIFQDTDNDGICDVDDICPNFNDNLIGQSCDDGDPCTEGETYNANCGCTGGIFQDNDNDGICNAEDECPDLDNATLGQACDDGDPNTKFDTYNSNTCGCSGIITTSTICVQINSSSDDAEENVSSGAVTINSGDLDIVNDEGVIFKVGMRFTNLSIPQGVTVSDATIQFGADEVNSEVTNLTFRGELSNNATIFTTSVNNISNRTTTSASVTWQPDPWTAIGDNGAAQKTIDLSPIIQEVVNQVGYVEGNAIAIIVEGTGIRTAESFDGVTALAPELCITYESNECIVGYPCDDTNSNTINDAYDTNCECTGEDIALYAKVLLEGFYDSANNNMHTKLNNNNLLPLTQPYNTAPWNYSGTESVTTIPSGAVDWILIMTRDANGNVLDQVAGFVTQSGELMSIQGTIGIPIDNALENRFSIHHRSHLAILSSNNFDGTTYDFTTAVNQASGNEQLKLIDGKFMLYGGDYDNTGIINSNDFNLWTIQSAIINQYIPIDGDGNGIVNSLDYNLWTNNKSKVGEPTIWY